MSKTIVIAGGGWAGCAAAVSARRQGMDVILLERTDMLLGTGLVGGIMRNNGRFTVTEELIAMGGGQLFQIIDANCRHHNVEFPGHAHASLYDIGKMPGAIGRYMTELGIQVQFQSRVVKANMEANRIRSVEMGDGTVIPGDVFIDATGTAGPMNNCARYGNGCAMCILRCPSFGGRVSLTALAGVAEMQGRQKNGTLGAMSGSCKLYKESLAPPIRNAVEESGVAVIPIPKALWEDHLEIKACQQYALQEYRESLILLDTGHAKLMAPFFPLEKLRRIPGFEDARYEDPYAGGKGNSMRFFAMAPRDDTLQVLGVKNLFCAGEKAGLLVGHTEAIVTGTLAGLNSARQASGKKLRVLSRETAAGEAIAYTREAMKQKEGLCRKYTVSGSVLFERIQALGLYEVNQFKIHERVRNLGLSEIFS